MVSEHEQIRPRGVRREDPCVSFWAHRVGRGKPRQAGEFGMHLAMTGKALEARSSGTGQVRDLGGSRAGLSVSSGRASSHDTGQGKASSKETFET